ncbi:MAG: tRNA epoxyqueuosine(34) reductase QueG [Gammaproteobacteria bacterium]|nr:tRNA epoxyqueuosine(34) reductase QueG [Gammaproteobacteria bacterium]
MESNNKTDWQEVASTIKQLGKELGFQQIGITDTELANAETYLHQWLGDNQHGDMQWMALHGTKRTRPAELVANTIRIISVRMDYLPPDCAQMQAILDKPASAYISRYALGRDYHKLMRKRLQKLVSELTGMTGEFGYRIFVDSAPVMEKPLAEKAGLGWIGKHTNLLNKQAGSWFFLGEIYTDMPLPVDEPAKNHCGDCQACIDICPTRAITAPYQLDARLCISYLTIEHQGAIPLDLRPLIGNRIYGCDDCQICCPWNRFADFTHEKDFHPRHHLDDIDLLEIFEWDEATFLSNTEGSAIRRIGHERWLRNIVVALGNCQTNQEQIVEALKSRRQGQSGMLQEHIDWAIERLGG